MPSKLTQKTETDIIHNQKTPKKTQKKVEFSTKVEINAGNIGISHTSRILLLGSCFTDNIGQRMLAGGLEATVNPWGTLYNPMSILEALTRPDDDFCRWSQRVPAEPPQPDSYNLLILTFGTAYVFRLRESGRIVANCKKQPGQLFCRQRLGVDEIVDAYSNFIDTHIVACNQKLLLTVSPIRHRSDGMHANQLSKAILLMAADILCNRYPDHVAYFPAYEIMMDELRDYRFYADDMLHPSPMAVEYIWQRFSTTYCDKHTRELICEFEKLNRTLAHRPTDAGSTEYQTLKSTTEQRIKQLKHAIQN